jgi:hypothetical protein
MSTANAEAARLTAITLAALPALGQPLDAGHFCGLTTRADGTHCAVVLLPDQPDADLDWKDAKAWAAGLDAELPTRPVAAQLFALAKGQLKPYWHWTQDEHSASFAWYCSFTNGDQFNNLKSAGGSCLAVRLIPLTA